MNKRKVAITREQTRMRTKKYREMKILKLEMLKEIEKFAKSEISVGCIT